MCGRLDTRPAASPETDVSKDFSKTLATRRGKEKNSINKRATSGFYQSFVQSKISVNSVQTVIEE